MLLTSTSDASVINWTNLNGGHWSVATNWSPNTVPAATDDVFITATGNFTVTQDVHVVVNRFTLGGTSGIQTYTNGTGNLTLKGASTVNSNGVLQFGAGTMAGDANLNVEGKMVWTGGTIGGVVIFEKNGVLEIGGSGVKYLTGVGTLINYGSVVWSGTNDIQTGNAARFINQPGGLFEIQNDQSFAIYNGGAITNLGILRKSAGGANTRITVPLYNAGVLDVQSGSVSYGAGSHFDDGTAFTGAGTNFVNAGKITFNGSISSENLEIGGATIAGHGLFRGYVNWTDGELTSGSVTIASDGVLRLSGIATKYLTGTGALINYGSVVWSGTNDIQTGNAARFINQPGGLFEIQNDQSFAIYNGGAITNLGILRKSAGGANTRITVPLHNSGTIDVQNGTITFGKYTQLGGGLNFGLNSLTDFGRLTFNEGVALTGAFGVSLNGSFVPVAGNSFALVAYPSRTGAFVEFDLPDSHAWQTNASMCGSTALTLTVLNTRPTLVPVPPQAGDEDATIAFTANATDADPGQTMAFTLVDPPLGATMVTNTGVFSWTPAEAQGPSTNRITVQVTDSGLPSLSVTQVVTVVVNEVNRVPVLTGPSTQSLDELTTLTATGLATDPDIPANRLSFSLITGPPGVNLDTETGVLTWTPTEAQGPSTNTIAFAVTDNGSPPLSATNRFIVRVLESNLPPVLATVPDLTVIQGLPLAYTNAANDPDLPANSLTFDLVSSPPGMLLDDTTGVMEWSPSAAQVPSTNAVSVRVTDNGQPTASDLKTFLVVALPLPSVSISRVGADVVLYWPTYAAGFRLQQTTDLKPAVIWESMTNAVTVEGETNLVTNRMDMGWHWFRLHHALGSQ